MIRRLKENIKSVRAGIHRKSFLKTRNASIVFMNAAFRLCAGLSLLLFFFSFGNAAKSNHSAPVAEDNNWHYMKGASAPRGDWTHRGFDDSDWLKGPSGIGYGKSGVTTHIRDMKGKYKKVYARKKFYVDNPRNVRKMVFSLVCDGPFIAYLNGIEVIRNPVGLPLLPDSSAEPLDLSGFIHELLPEENVVSVQCENDAIDSQDFLLIPALEVRSE